MTTTDYHRFASTSAARRPRPSGIERAATRVGLALVLWARARAEHAAPSREEAARRLQAERENQARMRAAYVRSREL